MLEKLRALRSQQLCSSAGRCTKSKLSASDALARSAQVRAARRALLPGPSGPTEAASSAPPSAAERRADAP
jgi:hypothetical protein